MPKLESLDFYIQTINKQNFITITIYYMLGTILQKLFFKIHFIFEYFQIYGTCANIVQRVSYILHPGTPVVKAYITMCIYQN